MSRRIRTIKPEFFSDEKLGRLGLFTRFTFMGLISLADDYGAVRFAPRTICGELFEWDEDVSSRDIRESLARLVGAGRIALFQDSGETFIQVLNWPKHQKVDRPSKRRLPGFDESKGLTITEALEVLGQGSRVSRETVARVSSLDHGSGSRIMDHGSEKKSAREAPAAPASSSTLSFDDRAVLMADEALAAGESGSHPVRVVWERFEAAFSEASLYVHPWRMCIGPISRAVLFWSDQGRDPVAELGAIVEHIAGSSKWGPGKRGKDTSRIGSIFGAEHMPPDQLMARLAAEAHASKAGGQRRSETALAEGEMRPMFADSGDGEALAEGEMRPMFGGGA